MPGACRRVTRCAARTQLVPFSYLGPVPHDASYYAKCMLGGAIACGFTHAGITPLDVAKCNMQVSLSTRILSIWCPSSSSTLKYFYLVLLLFPIYRLFRSLAQARFNARCAVTANVASLS